MSSSRSDWLVTLLLSRLSFHFPYTLSVGSVDFVFSSKGIPRESSTATEAVRRSALSWGIEADLGRLPRASVIVKDSLRQEAFETAYERIHEALDVLKLAFHSFGRVGQTELGRFSSVDVGYMQDLATKEYTPIENERAADTPVFGLQDLEPGLMFFRCLLAPEHARSELEGQLLRALKWKRRAELDGNTSDALLFYWLGIESLAKLTKADKSGLVLSRALLTLGFPGGRISEGLPETTRSALSAIPGYRNAATVLKRRLYGVVKIRDAIVHEGHAELDVSHITPGTSVTQHLSLLGRCTAQLSWSTATAIGLGYSTRKDMWQDAARVVASLRPLERIAQTTIETVL